MKLIGLISFFCGMILAATQVLAQAKPEIRKFNVSSQGAVTCELAVRKTVETVFGADQSYRLTKNSVVEGECRNGRCKPDLQTFEVRFDRIDPRYAYRFKALGPTKEGRCFLEMRKVFVCYSRLSSDCLY